VKAAELAPHYRAVTEITGLAAHRDDLEEIFPLHCDQPHALQSSRQADLLFRNLNRHRDVLRERGWLFGRARVAVSAADNAQARAASTVAFACMVVLMAAFTTPPTPFANCARKKNFTYQRDVIITSLREPPKKFFITGHHRETRAPLAFEADRVYLAAGVIPTAQILLRSQAAYDQPLTLRDSQYFLFPLLLARRTRDVQTEALYTLSQLFHRTEQLADQPPQRASAALHLQRHHRTGHAQIARAVENVRAPA